MCVYVCRCFIWDFFFSDSELKRIFKRKLCCCYKQPLKEANTGYGKAPFPTVCYQFVTHTLNKPESTDEQPEAKIVGMDPL